jgi:hypothetical protein
VKSASQFVSIGAETLTSRSRAVVVFKSDGKSYWSGLNIFSPRKANNGTVKTGKKKQPLEVRCPTCGAKPGEKCELGTGLPRNQPHRDRRLAAKEN